MEYQRSFEEQVQKSVFLPDFFLIEVFMSGFKHPFTERSEATSTKHTQRWNELVLVVRAARWSSGQWGSACATPFPCFQESFLSLVTFHNEERPKWQSGSDHGG
ncbi:hypothetical protein F2Q70_00029420 [Brassica cretica]|uniref:Uncharacterized protein n=1 Tax=Brassica cretica TaxID=69181 RepID=A0A8S9FM32_BRACR|nr:hypothetical protein F2Q70_00029420 [Brassica cretica]KAF3593158.1 hypothetical protein DY000_02021061 [Brassica cretica]